MQQVELRNPDTKESFGSVRLVDGVAVVEGERAQLLIDSAVFTLNGRVVKPSEGEDYLRAVAGLLSRASYISVIVR